MSIFTTVFKSLMVERPARKHDYAGWAGEIERDGKALSQKLRDSAESEKNRKVLSHVIGIERWAQSRAKVALGEPFTQDEYDGYRPARDASWSDMVEQFSAARAESVNIAKQYAAANLPITTTVQHNDFGDLTTRGWLRYIYMHGSFEARAIK